MTFQNALLALLFILIDFHTLIFKNILWNCRCFDSSLIKLISKTLLLDLAPSYGNTCPQDFEISYEYCSAAPRLNTWTPPKWTDDFTRNTYKYV